MHRFPAERRLAWGVVVGFAALAPLVGWGTIGAMARMENNVVQWLPADYESTQSFFRFLQHFDPDAFVLVSWPGCTLDDPRVGQLAEGVVGATSLEKGVSKSRCFQRVITGPSLLQTLQSAPIEISREEALARLRGSLVGPDLNTTCVVFSMSEYGVFHMREALAELHRVAYQRCGLTAEQLKLGGPPVDNVALDEAGEQSMLRVLGLSTTFGLFVCWWCLKQPRLIAMVVAVGLFTVALSLSALYFTGGVMNAVVLTMPALVYVAAVSGAIHLANYYREQAPLVGPRRAPWAAVRLAALPLGLATLTTCTGLLSMTVSELSPIRDFGLYSALGTLLGLACLLLLLPAALVLWPIASAPHDEESSVTTTARTTRFWRSAADFVLVHARPLAAATWLLLALTAVGFSRVETSVQIMRLFDDKAKILADYRWLEQNLGPLAPVEIVVRFAAECPLSFGERMTVVQAMQHRVTAAPHVGSALSAATFTPTRDDAQQTAARQFANSALGRATKALTGGRPLAARVQDVRLERRRDDLLRTGFLREDGEAELWRITARVAALEDVDYYQFEQNVRHTVAPLQQALARRGVTGLDVSYTGVLPIVYQAQNSLLWGMIVGYGADVALIVLAMSIAVRSWSAGWLLMLPSVLPAVAVLGAFGLLGIVIDMGSVMPPCVALGVTVDDVMHFLLQFRRSVQAGQTRRQATLDAYRHCGRAMYQSWAVLGLGNMAFAFSPFAPTQRFGLVMVALLTVALWGNLVFLPALLQGWLGRVWVRSIRARASRSTAAEFEPAVAALPASTRPVVGELQQAAAER